MGQPSGPRDNSTASMNTGLSLFALENPVEVVDMEENRNFDIILGFDVLRLFSFSFSSQEYAFQLVVRP